MMSKQEFYEEIKENIREYLPPEYEDAEISLTTQVKNMDVEMTGLLIRLPGESAAPVIYLDSMYEQYEDGRPMEGILMEVADPRRGASLASLSIDPDTVTRYSEVRDKLQIRLLDTRANRKRLDNLVHHSYGDLTACYCVVLKETPENSMGCMVTPSMMKCWGITKRQLHEDAIEADTLRGVFLFDMSSVEAMILEGAEPVNMLGEGAVAPEPDQPPKLMCLTSGSRMYGAGLIVDPRIQEQIAGVCGGSYFILPSSVHEVLIMKDDGGRAEEAPALEGLVQEINATTVDPSDRLSDHVQYYDAGSKQIVNAMAFERENREIAPPARSMRI